MHVCVVVNIGTSGTRLMHNLAALSCTLTVGGRWYVLSGVEVCVQVLQS